jgi:hypothetical protein
MTVENFNRETNQLVLSGSVARLYISHVFGSQKEWAVDWEITEPNGKVVGSTIFSNTDLALAFDIISGFNHEELAKRYDAESASQGRYIRWKRYLNIPCPGTGLDGDPNISIWLSEPIKNAVKELLYNVGF